MPQNALGIAPHMIWGIGVVEDRQDPKKLGRCRVRVIGVHSHDRREVPIEHLPWAHPMMPITNAGTSSVGTAPIGPVEGTWVVVMFRDGENLQDPIMMGTLSGIPAEQRSPEMAFSDPQEGEGPAPPRRCIQKADGSGSEVVEGRDGGYPRKEFLNEPDMPRLATGIEGDEFALGEQTIVEEKKENRKIGQMEIPTARAMEMKTEKKPAGEFSEPEIPYKAVYPYNHVEQSESGHVREVDDTPGAERLHEYHRAGTFREIHPDGSQVVKIVMDKYEIVLRDEYVHIEGKTSRTSDKGHRWLINKDQEYGEDLDIEIGQGGGLNITVNSGDVNISVLDGDVNSYINGNKNEIVTGDMNRMVYGNFTETIQGTRYQTIGRNEIALIGLNSIRTITGGKTENVLGSQFRSTAGVLVETVGMWTATKAEGLIVRSGQLILDNPDKE